MAEHQRAAAAEREASSRRVIVIAASAGGLQALSVVLGGLPAALPAAIAVVQHRDPHYEGGLVEILAARTALRVLPAMAGEQPRAGVVYVAPLNQHLTFDAQGALALDSGPRVEFVRPSATVLFESAAERFGAGAIAVVLTGHGKDAVQGVRAIVRAGGAVIVQNPATAAAPGMPLAALATGCPARILELPQIAADLVATLGGTDTTRMVGDV